MCCIDRTKIYDVLGVEGHADSCCKNGVTYGPNKKVKKSHHVGFDNILGNGSNYLIKAIEDVRPATR